MKNLLFLFVCFYLFGCNQNVQPKKADPVLEIEHSTDQYFFIGTYTGTDTGSNGIYKASIDQHGKMMNHGLASQSDNPSFLVIANNKSNLIAVNEISGHGNMGSIESYEIKKDTLILLSTSTTGGAHPCHVQVNSNGDVIASNYTGGNIGLLSIDENGNLSNLKSSLQFEGSGPNKERQEAAHAHSSWFLNDKTILSADLGTDHVWKVDYAGGRLALDEEVSLQLNPGAGPRHLAIHPHGEYIYSMNELDNTVGTISINKKGDMTYESSSSTLPKDFKGFNKTADIHIDRAGKFLYASNRGHNSIAVFKIGDNGKLNHIQRISTEGDGPRNFQITPDQKFVIVANQHTGNLVSFSRDLQTGMLRLNSNLSMPSPVCIAFL